MNVLHLLLEKSCAKNYLGLANAILGKVYIRQKVSAQNLAAILTNGFVNGFGDRRFLCRIEAFRLAAIRKVGSDKFLVVFAYECLDSRLVVPKTVHRSPTKIEL